MGEGTVVLIGQVLDSDDKETAVNVASDTEGVIRVEDRLSVPPAPRVFAIKTDEKVPARRRTR
jgi:BON domain